MSKSIAIPAEYAFWWYSSRMTKYIVSALALLILIAGYWYWGSREAGEPTVSPASTPSAMMPNMQAPLVDESRTILGKSVQGREVVAYHFGTGKEVVFVGGIHGGYSWNTALVAYELMDYLESNPAAIPAGVKVTVIPVANPDGLQLATGTTSRFTKADVTTSAATRSTSRFNANIVDLNRNFDCDWQREGTWQNTKVSGGTAAFSEPESVALKSYFERVQPAAVVAWYSAAGGVYQSRCGDAQPSETAKLTGVYAQAAGYPSFADFTHYTITGDMPNWLARIGVPAISVLLTTHDSTEWAKNQRGIQALLAYLAQ